MKMIVKGRSPTMRHVSRPHRVVALDGLFDRINLDPKIQIKYSDAKNQLADMLTKGNFTRDEWNRLVRLVNIMSFAMFSCSHFSPITNPSNHVEEADAGSKTLEKRNVWLRNLKPMMSLVSKAADQSPIALGSSAPYSPGTLKAQSSNSNLAGTGRPVARGLNENTASSSQVWYSDVNPSSSAGKLVAETSRKPIGTQQSHHNLRMSKNNAGYLEKVYSYSRQKIWS